MQTNAGSSSKDSEASGSSANSSKGSGKKRRRLFNSVKEPETPIEFLAQAMRRYVYMPDPSVLYALMGSVAANLVDGLPVWLLLVGPPGCGKSMLLDSLKGLHGLYAADSFDQEAAFLSGTAKKDRAKNATGGLLRQVGEHGGLVIKDFTGILSMAPDRIRKILDVFRQVYDGSWDRPIGAEGGRTLHWGGKCAVLSGVTGKIDEYHTVSSTLGERWLFFRMGSGNGFAQLKQGLQNASVKNWADELRDMVTLFFEELDLRFGRSEPRRALNDYETTRIARIAEVAAHCRSGVTRDWRNKDIVAAPETEFESRIGGQLGQLYIGMEVIGVPELERWKVVGKIALDSMPKIRRMILDRVMDSGGKGALVSDILKSILVEEAISAGRAVVDRSIVDLAIHGVVKKKRVEAASGSDDAADAGKVRVVPTQWMVEEYRKGFGT